MPSSKRATCQPWWTQGAATPQLSGINRNRCPESIGTDVRFRSESLSAFDRTTQHGHASTQITLDRYSHVIESMQLSAAVAIGRFLQPVD